ncbi:sensor histidine kinase [Persephonella sp.]
MISFEKKILIIFTVILTVGFSVINGISILYFKKNLEYQLYKEATLYKTILSEKHFLKLPYYFKIDNKLNPEKYEVITFWQENYILLDKNYKINKIKTFGLNLVIWEGILIITLLFIMYITIIRYIREKEENRKLLEILLLTITHKLGNFLSSQRLNIELIKSKCNIKPVERLEKGYLFIENDFKTSLKMIKKLSERKEEIKSVNIKHILTEIISLFEENLKNKKVYLNLKDFYIKMDSFDAENIFHCIIENAVKYSDKKIYIKTCVRRNICYVFIRNDISEISKGSGIGLKIAEFLISKYGGEIKTKVKKNYFTVVKLKK